MAYRRIALAAGLLSLAACRAEITHLSAKCAIALSAASPEEAKPGDVVTLTGRPLTAAFDTAVYLDSTRATVLEVTRDDCDDCDDCQEEEGCTACSDCDDCADACEEDCVETVTFEVPQVAAGIVEVRLYNQHGESAPLPFTVTAAPDTGEADTGDSDSGGSSSGTVDSGNPGPG